MPARGGGRGRDLGPRPAATGPAGLAERVGTASRRPHAPRHDFVARIFSSSTRMDIRCIMSPARRKGFIFGWLLAGALRGLRLRLARLTALGAAWGRGVESPVERRARMGDQTSQAVTKQAAAARQPGKAIAFGCPPAPCASPIALLWQKGLPEHSQLSTAITEVAERSPSTCRLVRRARTASNAAPGRAAARQQWNQWRPRAPMRRGRVQRRRRRCRRRPAACSGAGWRLYEVPKGASRGAPPGRGVHGSSEQQGSRGSLVNPVRP